MSIESRSRKYGKVFGHWQIKEFLGSGSGGKSAVFRLVHTDSNSLTCALKVISLIEKRGRYEDMPASRKSEYESAKKKCKERARQEVLLMHELQSRTNTVDYLDHTFIDWVDETGFGCDMLIRMELLKDLRSEIENDRSFKQEEIIKIGRDVCNALVLCHGKNILHRDIKPENIFYNSDGNYKLGDFGVSRILSASPMSKASTGVCTPEYAAPEQMAGKYDKRVDIYSLGLVLYELSNGNLLPFATSSYVTEYEVQERLLGKPLPAPRKASKTFSDVILKACAFDPEDRYQTAEEFLAELNYLAGVGPRPVRKAVRPVRQTQKAERPSGGYATQYATPGEIRSTGGRETVYAVPQTDSISHASTARKAPPKAMLVIALILVIVIAAGVIGWMGASAKAEAIEAIIDEANVLAGSENYDSAIEKIRDGLEEYPESVELQDKEKAYTEALSAQTKTKTMDQAKSLADSGDYVTAITLLKNALENQRDDADYQIALNTYIRAYIVEVIDSTDEMAANNEYLGAFKAIETATTFIGEDEELSAKAIVYENGYAMDISSQVDDLLADNDITAAKSLLQTASKEFPDNDILRSRIEELNEYKIVLLDSLSPTNGGFTWNEGVPEDPFNNTYSALQNHVILHSDYSSWDGHGGNTATHSVEYNVDKKYDTISFNIVPYSEFGENGWSYLRIYVNGVLRYTSDKITQKSQPQGVTVDISDAKYIEIIVYTDEFSCTMLTDVVLSKLPNFNSTLRTDITSLSEIDVFNGSIPWENDFPSDTLKSEYNYVTNYAVLHAAYSSWDGHGGNAESYSAEYYLNKQYTTLNFDIAPAGGFGASGYASIKVYVDDVLKYTAPAITQKTARFNTGDIDVTNASYLKIVADIDEHSCTIISDVLLKNVD